jgi:hypothetical protein
MMAIYAPYQATAVMFLEESTSPLSRLLHFDNLLQPFEGDMK